MEGHYEMVYEKGYFKILAKPAVAAIMLSICVLGASIWIPLSTQPFGLVMASFLEGNSDKIEFWWIYNCTLVNENLTEHYRQEQVTAYVDGVYLFLNSSVVQVSVLFAPYTEKIVGRGQLSAAAWANLSDSLIHSGIGRMERAAGHPDYFPNTWPIELLMEVYFNDNTLFYIGYSAQQHLVYVQSGSWSGKFAESGWPIVTGYAESGEWLEEAGHLQGVLPQFLVTILNAVPLYPT